MKTKTTFLLAVLFFTVAFNAYSQKRWKLEFSIEPHGSKGGDFHVPVDVLNNNTPFVPMENEFRTGVAVGADIGYFFEDKMGMSIGLHYAGLGSDYRNYVWSYSGTSATLSKNISLDYLKFPVLFHYVSSPAQKTSFTLAAGFYFATLLGYRDEMIVTSSSGDVVSLIAENENLINTYTSGSNSQTETAVFTTEPFTSGDVGGALSLGLVFQLSKNTSLPVLLNYEFGFNDVKNKSSSFRANGDTYLYWDDGIGTRPNLTEDYTNSSIGIKIGVMIALGVSDKK